MRLFDMMTDADLERIKEDRGPLDLTLKIEQLELANKKLKKRAEEAEGENTIIKGIGQNSPEMKALQKEVERLKNSRPLDTMDEIAYHELEARNKANLQEIDRLSEENTNLKTMMKGKNGNS